MSSVLKALKKAEEDGSLYASNPDLRSNVQRILHSKNWHQPENTWFTPKKILLSSVCLLAFIFLIVFFMVPQKQQNVANIKQVPVKDSPPVRQQTASENRIPMPDPQVPSVVERPQPTALDNPEIPQETISPAPHKQGFKPDTDAQPISRKTNEDKADIDPIEDNDIIIQAISWATDPKERIAVINNNIVSENEMVSDYQVTQIRKDEVILSRSGKKFSLKFKYR